ncbi:hypothetical protein Taro_004771 [Colocasia esculenta]|uniref:Uncharacterized protein n=1 Tax=Colocasia esculenta TaxID=4460 RepID=A0A843TN83_COLES|nr:hypothetical protein [Colocasia esculenta]
MLSHGPNQRQFLKPSRDYIYIYLGNYHTVSKRFCSSVLLSNLLVSLGFSWATSAMAGNHGFLLIFLAMALLCKEIQAVKSSSLSPAAQPTVPGPAAQPKLPMYGFTEGSLQPQECSGRCTARCSKTQYHKPCMFFCQKCCAKCLCVPPGTYGNKQFCPCYNNWKTKRGGPKCP